MRDSVYLIGNHGTVCFCSLFVFMGQVRRRKWNRGEGRRAEHRAARWMMDFELPNMFRFLVSRKPFLVREVRLY